MFGTFPFELSDEDEARARRLHEEAIVIDLLMHGPCGYLNFSDDEAASMLAEFRRNGGPTAFMDAMELPVQWAAEGRFDDLAICWRDSGITAAATGISVGSRASLQLARAVVERRARLPWLHQARTAADIRAAKSSGDHCYFLNCQPIEPLSRDLSLLDEAVALGLRMLMLTYNQENPVGFGCTEPVDGGLSAFGVSLVQRLQGQGVLVDVSHCGRRTTLDACRVAEAPVVASHIGAKAVFQHVRNKTDEELEAIADTGGMVGVYAVPAFVGPGQPTIEAMLDHLDHLVTLVGSDRVCLGTDWPVQLPKVVLPLFEQTARQVGFRPEHELDDELNLIGFDDYRDMPNIARGLVARGYSDIQVRQILGENALRLMDSVWR